MLLTHTLYITMCAFCFYFCFVLFVFYLFVSKAVYCYIHNTSLCYDPFLLKKFNCMVKHMYYASLCDVPFQFFSIIFNNKILGRCIVKKHYVLCTKKIHIFYAINDLAQKNEFLITHSLYNNWFLAALGHVIKENGTAMSHSSFACGDKPHFTLLFTLQFMYF